ncbi:ATP-binding cassette domain-containing protein [Actinocorallia sp. A-T 12471]|uniref:ATP-binding cassette domain-containing protein n=1 Tax=Actinocorallia sp. A-T 12471 TaxID=3089813 RepID=UPI0029D1E6BF|nr:ATP-binding cassette domain-containing protein [Actinocorallia sp. A-T 12471]MDX6742788.1 ATP-binding cassette domain-containing protein [Actinocorallia sp. A-T 12471]
MITARGLSRTFTVARATVTAVEGLDLDVAEGELVAFLGPNGAGKSTTIKMLTTLLPATSGTATVAGHDVSAQRAAVRRAIGYVGQGNSAGHNQRVRDELLSQGAFYGLSGRESARRADELIDSLDLAALVKRPVSGLSGGQKRRVDIALGLIHRPRVLFLDEPSTGLDPQSRANLWQHILDLRRSHGTTVFLTTHYLEEADQYAERVLVMDHGRVIADDSADRLKAELAGDTLTIGFGTPEDAEAAAPVIGKLTARTPERVDPLTLRVSADSAAPLVPELTRALDAAAAPPHRIALREPTLDDVFLALTGRTLRDTGDTSPTTPEPAPTP